MSKAGEHLNAAAIQDAYSYIFGVYSTANLEWKVVNYDWGKYEGQCKKGTNIAEGYGTSIGNNGVRYRGYCKDDLRHGFGVKIWPDGSKYIGE